MSEPGVWLHFRVLLTDPVGWEETLQGDTEWKTWLLQLRAKVFVTPGSEFGLTDDK